MLPKKKTTMKNGLQLHTQNEMEVEEPGITFSSVIATGLVIVLIVFVFQALSNGQEAQNNAEQERQQLIQQLKERTK